MVRVWNVKKEKRKKKEPFIFNTIFKLKKYKHKRTYKHKHSNLFVYNTQFLYYSWGCFAQLCREKSTINRFRVRKVICVGLKMVT